MSPPPPPPPKASPVDKLKKALLLLPIDVQEALCVVCGVLFLLVVIDYTWWYIVSGVTMGSLWKVLRSRFMKADIRGDLVCITGATGTVGACLAKAFVERGCRLVLIDSNVVMLDALENELRKLGCSQCISFAADVTNREVMLGVSERVLRDVGHVSILVNLASMKSGFSFSECPDHLLLQSLEVNMISRLWTARAFLSHMVDKNRGWIVEVVSQDAILGATGLFDRSLPQQGAVAFQNCLQVEMRALRRAVKVVTCVANIEEPHDAPHRYEASVFPQLFTPRRSPEDLSQRIVNAVLSGERHVYYPCTATFIPYLQLLPSFLYEGLMNITSLDTHRTLRR
ncbi:Epidermal retinal dehydrogenase 2 [Diplonema papillatum]|nr:Epidermal retinal dehydrogenase 2 [Diplonema papillatum]